MRALPSLAAALLWGLIMAAAAANLGSLSWKQGVFCAAAAAVALASQGGAWRRFEAALGAVPSPSVAVLLLALCVLVSIPAGAALSVPSLDGRFATRGGVAAAIAVAAALVALAGSVAARGQGRVQWLPRSVGVALFATLLMSAAVVAVVRNAPLPPEIRGPGVDYSFFALVPLAICVAVAGLFATAHSDAGLVAAPLGQWRNLLAAALVVCAAGSFLGYLQLRGDAGRALGGPCAEAISTGAVDSALAVNRSVGSHSFEVKLLERKASCLIEAGDRRGARAAYEALAAEDPQDERWPGRISALDAQPPPR